MRTPSSWSLVLLACFSTGCATLVGDRYQDIPIDSRPAGAHIVVTDETGSTVLEGVTPTTVRLKKGRGYFSGKEFVVELSKPGYGSQTVWIYSTPSNWYLFGNLVSFDVIGWVLVDPITGAMWRLEPESIQVELQPTSPE